MSFHKFMMVLAGWGFSKGKSAPTGPDYNQVDYTPGDYN